jgi:hypothetical protein
MPELADLPKLSPVDTGDGYSLDIDFYLKHDYSDIGEAMEKLPAIIEYVNARMQSMVESKIIQKQAVKETESRAYFTLRNGAFEDRFGGKITESALEKAVALDPEVVKAHESYAVLVGWSQRLMNLMLSLQLKLDMVRSTEATRRTLASGEDDKED